MGIIKRPALTEKSQAMQEKGKYVFVVELTANKIEIAKEVKKMYGVDVQDVQTMRQIGKKKIQKYTYSGYLGTHIDDQESDRYRSSRRSN